MASVRTPFRQAQLSQHSACRPRIEMSVFQSPDLARIHPAMTEESLAYYRRRDADRSGLDRIIGASPRIVELKQQIARVLEMETRQLSGGRAG